MEKDIVGNNGIVVGNNGIVVGTYEKKEVSTLNHELYNNACTILEDNQHMHHIGWSGVGTFIDWLEDNYDIKRKKEDLV